MGRLLVGKSMTRAGGDQRGVRGILNIANRSIQKDAASMLPFGYVAFGCRSGHLAWAEWVEYSAVLCCVVWCDVK
jgi:hypothetical protein